MLGSAESTPIPAALAGPAAALAAAQRTAEGTCGRLAEVTAHHDLVAARLDELDAKRRDLATRRTAGNAQPSDAAELGLLDLDREDLTRMLAEASAAVATVRTAHGAAENAVSTKKTAMDRIEAETLEASLGEHFRVLEARMTETLTRLDQVGRQLHRQRPVVIPSAELRTELRRLAAAHGQF